MTEFNRRSPGANVRGPEWGAWTIGPCRSRVVRAAMLELSRALLCARRLASTILLGLAVSAVARADVVDLIASDAGIGDHFGQAVAVSRDWMVVGAPGHGETGLAYLFERRGGNWVERAQLRGVSGASGFGSAVGVHGDRVIVGNPFEGTGGAAYVFRHVRFTLDRYGLKRTYDYWIREARLAPADASLDQRFGTSVALSGDRALVGAPFDDQAGTDAGAAYVFRRENGAWFQERKITARDALDAAHFGSAVAIDGGTIAIGAPEDDGAIPYPHPYLFYNSSAGAAYVYRLWYFPFSLSGELRLIPVWSEAAKLLPSDPGGGDRFGHALDVSGNSIAVAARWRSYDRKLGNGRLK